MRCSALIRRTSYPYLTCAHAEPSEHQLAHQQSNQFIKKGEQEAGVYSVIARFTTQ